MIEEKSASQTYSFQRPKKPSFILERQERLREKALAEGLKALLAIEQAGGIAVLFGSVLQEGEFSERSDIDICVLDPPDFSKGHRFLRVAENAVNGFVVDVSWVEDLKDAVRENVIREGKSAPSLRRDL